MSCDASVQTIGADENSAIRIMSCDASVQASDDSAASTRHAATSHPEWTLDAWLASCSVTDVLVTLLAEHMGATVRNSRDGLLAAVTSEEQLCRTLNDLRATTRLASALWVGIESLRASSETPAAATTSTSRFAQDATSLLRYGGLETYYGGLERIVGVPDPRASQALCAEHTQRADSPLCFTSPNYQVATTSAIEYAFVATPEHCPTDGWPAEAVQMPTGASPRTVLTLGELTSRLAPPNGRLVQLQEAPVTIEEAQGARLYTGPCFVKYNFVLRTRSSRGMSGDGQGQDAEQALVELTRGNLYTTTLFLINSSVVKLGKLTAATPVYRGISGRALPDEFWTRNEFGVRGGIEPGFMSTSTDKSVAQHYAAAGRSTGFVFEIQQGMIDRGADLSIISQYPHEREILFAPLTGLEVQSTRVEGAVLFIAVRLSVNLRSLTFDEVCPALSVHDSYPLVHLSCT